MDVQESRAWRFRVPLRISPAIANDGVIRVVLPRAEPVFIRGNDSQGAAATYRPFERRDASIHGPRSK